jgi:hypothetical protein
MTKGATPTPALNLASLRCVPTVYGTGHRLLTMEDVWCQINDLEALIGGDQSRCSRGPVYPQHVPAVARRGFSAIPSQPAG